MQTDPRPQNPMGKWLKLLLKIAVTVVCLWYVSRKIDFTKAGEALGKADWFLLFLAFLVFVFSKLAAALRLNLYFRNINIHLSDRENIKLYWLGMFYNLFLPGSISGDAYKVILLNKRFNVSLKKTSAAVLLDRFSGLLGLGLLLAGYAVFVLKNNLYILFTVSGAVLAVVVVYVLVKYWLKDFIPSFFPTLLLGILVQAAQVACVYIIMAALGIPGHRTEYIFVFLVSSVVAVLPLTIGGLGARELVFLEGAKYFGLLQETSVVISLLFYLITLFTSAGGLIWVFRDPIDRRAGESGEKEGK